MTTTEIAIQDQLQEDLKRLDEQITEQHIAELQDYADLTISGVDDEEGYREVYDAHQVAKRVVSGIEKMRKALKANALAYGKAVDTFAKDLAGKAKPIADHLAAERQRIDDEKAEIARALEIEEEIREVWDEAHEANVRFDEHRAIQEQEDAARLAEAERLEAQRREQETREKELAAKEAEIQRRLDEALLQKPPAIDPQDPPEEPLLVPENGKESYDWAFEVDALMEQACGLAARLPDAKPWIEEKALIRKFCADLSELREK